MKHLTKTGASGLLFASLLFASGTQTALAVGTESGLDINNTATVNYKVGTVDQTAILSSPDGLTPTGEATTFKVDNKVDLTVASVDAGTVPVAPGALDQVLEFTVTNTGNTTQGYSLSAVADGANAIPMGSVEIWIDDPAGASPGVYDAGDTLYVAATNAGDLNPNGTIGTDDVMTVFIVSDTPATPTNGAVDSFSLLATTLDAATTTVTVDTAANTAAGVEVAFADALGTATGDAANDGTHSDAGTYTVNTASLTVTKTAVVDDQLGGTYAIPGAIVAYSIVVTNSGAAATDVVVSDPIPANTVYVAGTAAAVGGTVEYSTIATPTVFSTTEPAAATVAHIRATFATLADGTTTPTVATVTFDVEIQ